MKPTLGVFVGDLQCGGNTAIGLKDFELEEKIPLSLSRNQGWLWECWIDALARVKAAAVGHNIFLGLGGDMVEGVNHHGSTQTKGTPSKQAQMATQILLPYVNMATDARALKGTDDHTGPEGDGDSLVASELGIKIDYSWLLNISGRLLDWAHHGISVAQHPVNENNGHKIAAEKVYWWAKAKGIRVPDTIIRHHSHRSPRPIEWRGIRVAVGGCWQLSTSYGHKIAAGSPPDIGLLLWWPGTNHIERILYDAPREITTIGSGSSDPARLPTQKTNTKSAGRTV